MGTIEIIACVSLEWWRTAGIRSETRLRTLVRETRHAYPVNDADEAEAFRLALAKVTDHERTAAAFNG